MLIGKQRENFFSLSTINILWHKAKDQQKVDNSCKEDGKRLWMKLEDFEKEEMEMMNKRKERRIFL